MMLAAADVTSVTDGQARHCRGQSARSKGFCGYKYQNTTQSVEGLEHNNKSSHCNMMVHDLSDVKVEGSQSW